jgi:hypothetical protein
MTDLENPLTSLTHEQRLYYAVVASLHGWGDPERAWNPHPGQALVGQALFVDGAKKIFVQCGRKWGKTEIIVYCLWRYALLNSNVSCYYICPEAKHAREIVWESVDRRGRKRIQGFGPAEFIEHIDNQNLRITFKNGSFIKVDGSDNVDAWAGISPHFLVLDEFRSFRPEFLPVMNPNRATFDAPMIVIGTPPEQLWLDRETPHHYVELAKETREEMGEGMPSFWIHRPSWDNPDPIIQAFLKTEKATLLRKGREYEWLREYGAELVPGSARKVFPSFCPDVSKPKSHMVSELTVAKIIRGEGGYGITRS